MEIVKTDVAEHKTILKLTGIQINHHIGFACIRHKGMPVEVVNGNLLRRSLRYNSVSFF